MRSSEEDHEKFRKNRFSEMNRQIEELTSMVRAFTKKMTSSSEENDQNVRNMETSLRSDMLTGVSANQMPTPNTQQPRRTPQFFHRPNGRRHDGNL